MQIRDYCDSRDTDFEFEVSKEFDKISVITRYNNKAYFITGITFDINPKSKIGSDETDVTFVDYYKTKYNETITDLQQPLLLSVNRRTGYVSYLVPELCLMTGLTDQMKDDFKVMRDIRREVLTDAPVKVKEC